MKLLPAVLKSKLRIFTKKNVYIFFQCKFCKLIYYNKYYVVYVVEQFIKFTGSSLLFIELKFRNLIRKKFIQN